MTTATAESRQGMDRKDHQSSLRIHISCGASSSSFDDANGGGGGGPPHHQPHHQPHHHSYHRSAMKSVTKQSNNASGGSISPPSPILATNFHTVHPSAKYHPLARHAQKPLSTYTSLGTPIIPRGVIIGGGGGAGGRPRSLSLGSHSCLASNSTICNHHHNNNANGNGSPQHHPDLPEPPPPEVPTPPRLAARRQAEAAERARTVALERAEVDCDADELRLVLKKERARMSFIQAELTELRSGLAQEQLQAQVLEEECINGLVVRLDHLQEEKARIVLEEREQEMIASALRRRLEELSRQRRDLEAQVAAAECQTKALRIKIHSPTSSLHAVDERSFSSSTAMVAGKRHQEDITMEDG